MLPLVHVFAALGRDSGHSNDLARRLYVATAAILDDGFLRVVEHPSQALEAEWMAESTQGKPAAPILWDEAPVLTAPVRAKPQDSPSRARCGEEISRARGIIPREWAEQGLQVLTSADARFARLLLDALSTRHESPGSGRAYSDKDVESFARIVGRALRTGLVEVLSVDAVSFVWDQCVLSSFALCLPLAAATLLLAIQVEASELVSTFATRFPEDESGIERNAALKRLLRTVGPDVSVGEFERIFQQHALPFVRASVPLRELHWDADLACPPRDLADGGSFSLGVPLQLDVNNLARVWLSGERSPIGDAGIELNWVPICPEEDSVGVIVDRILSAPNNSDALSRAHALWAHGDDAELDTILRRALAVAVCRVLPCLAKLYARLPVAVSSALEGALDKSVVVALPAPCEESLTAAALGEDTAALSLILPSLEDIDDDLIRPNSPIFLCAAIVSLRASRLWPRLRGSVADLAAAACKVYDRQRELRAIETANEALREQVARATTKSDPASQPLDRGLANEGVPSSSTAATTFAAPPAPADVGTSSR